MKLANLWIALAMAMCPVKVVWADEAATRLVKQELAKHFSVERVKIPRSGGFAQIAFVGKSNPNTPDAATCFVRIIRGTATDLDLAQQIGVYVAGTSEFQTNWIHFTSMSDYKIERTKEGSSETVLITQTSRMAQIDDSAPVATKTSTLRLIAVDGGIKEIRVSVGVGQEWERTADCSFD